jgi:hypothetical protein
VVITLAVAVAVETLAVDQVELAVELLEMLEMEQLIQAVELAVRLVQVVMVDQVSLLLDTQYKEKAYE